MLFKATRQCCVGLSGFFFLIAILIFLSKGGEEENTSMQDILLNV